MRALALTVLLAAGPAQAQDFEIMQRTFELQMQATQARQREIDLSNQITALETRLRADDAVRAIEAQRDATANPMRAPSGPPPAPAYASIPDARLAASNARVRAAVRDAGGR